jgi:hypothetical protein
MACISRKLFGSFPDKDGIYLSWHGCNDTIARNRGGPGCGRGHFRSGHLLSRRLWNRLGQDKSLDLVNSNSMLLTVDFYEGFIVSDFFDNYFIAVVIYGQVILSHYKILLSF